MHEIIKIKNRMKWHEEIKKEFNDMNKQNVWRQKP